MDGITAQAPLIEVRELGKDYGKRRILDGVSLAVEPGCILGLVGRNGAGKSSLLECLLGLRRADRGSALVFGKPPERMDDADKMRLGYVPQQPDGFDWMTIDEMLGMIAGLYPGWDAQLAARLLDTWDLYGDRRLSTLSPGERQQVAIIRALAPRPALLVLDEPASALDPVARRTLLREIVDLALEDGTTVVFSTHIISDLERVASHVALLHGGRIRLHAALDDIKDSLRRLWWPASTPLPETPLAGELSRRPLEEGGWSLILRDADLQAGHWPAEARLNPLALEDLFVELAA
ncbi:ABC transporter ATP-binding protein [Thauera sp. Sel9]|uniref:ABC transporter ATP-binding protein n=1 Tax=Thauera sp. Sel9 TaxID=2974299 RepID=UPI0021E12421|nr:ABC transporter ATP-binding protein [Thauera sp. Sel9]MCV2216412.1 ABC transporter ATP-binding protein [Thauera sp. Sel9]